MPLEPIDGITVESESNARYEHCDYCFGSQADDYSANKEPRKMFRASGEQGLNVCEHCVAEYDAEELANNSV